jgi:drug/metabolite transporter (DMT)-like permease
MTRRAHSSTVKNAIFVAVVVITYSFGNLLIAMGMNRMPDFFGTAFLSYAWLLLTNAPLLGGTALLTIALIAQLVLFTWADLTYVLPVTASGYIVTAILGRYVLHDDVSVFRWAGIGVISLGVLLVSCTPYRTRPE